MRTNELDYERAMVADRKLRLLAKESEHFRIMRSKLRDLIAAYEKKEWSEELSPTTHKMEESDRAEQITI